MLNPDFRDMLSALAAERAEYLIVGAYAMANYGVPRATGDLDFWIRPTVENAERVLRALATFGAPMDRIALADLQARDTVIQIGVEPSRIDILTSITGLEFEAAYQRRTVTRIAELEIPFLGLTDLIRNKKATGRPRDVVDAEMLERTNGESLA